ncbi:MAG: M23 family metallopeptidase [Candidatus Moranbacteria bacterium]|jgi:murein DD-endopeptidase MepM/ murein hydrolase activator NlpD|nr:M23 family metallopeptidase [Candidatus Moranbacteria bacterium]
MKLFHWLILSLLFITVSVAVPWITNRPASEPELPVTQPIPIATSPVLETVTLLVSPTAPLQGEPALITVHGLASPSAIQSFTLDGKSLPIFADDDRLATLVGVDLHRTPGWHPIILTLHNGQTIAAGIEVQQRVLETTSFDIPPQLGGNTPKAEQELTSTLSQDTAVLNALTSLVSPEKLWVGQFQFPLNGSPTVTDVYGYSRQTGSVTLSHNGTDFRAPEGTPVYAMNSGTIVFAKSFRNYGNTVIIDHGLGVMTMYMHLSKINVLTGDSTEKGALIALSGNTGYSLGAHLHLSVRINGFSIDPLQFLELMGTQ